MDIMERSLQMHYEKKGKLEVISTVPVKNKEDLSLAYTPGVAEPCMVISRDVNKSFELTRRWNLVAVVTDGTAVLGLGDIGPEAGMPVMEGKCVLFHELGGVDAFPLCIRSKDVDEIVKTVSLLCGSFGGINLEDISAPRCFEIERKLKEICDIPIFHDDQHGTAIVAGAALLNSLRIVKKQMEDLKIVISGAGSAGIAIARLLLNLGAKNIILCDSKGAIHKNMTNLNSEKMDIAKITNPGLCAGSIGDVLVDADVFLGVSAPNIVTQDMVRSMAKDPIIFAMANPIPEIMPDLAKEAGAAIVGTGRSDFPNQINNVLAFPGIFRGALDCRAKDITEDMKIAATMAIAGMVTDSELNADNLLPNAFDTNVAKVVAKAVMDCARKTGVARI